MSVNLAENLFQQQRITIASDRFDWAWQIFAEEVSRILLEDGRHLKPSEIDALWEKANTKLDEIRGLL